MAPTLRTLAAQQVPPPGMGADGLAAAAELEPLGHGFTGLNAFRASHNFSISFQKSEQSTHSPPSWQEVFEAEKAPPTPPGCARERVRGLTRRGGGGRSNAFAMYPLFSNRTGLNHRVSGRVGSSPGRAPWCPDQVANWLAGRGVPGAAPKPAWRAERVHHDQPAAFRKRGTQTQAPVPSTHSSVPVRFRSFRGSGVGHQASTRFAFGGSAPVPMNCNPASPLPAICLTPSGSGPRLARGGIGNRVGVQHAASRQHYC